MLPERPEILTLTVTTSASVVVAPEVGLTVSHEALSLSVQLNVPPPLFVIVNVWLLGFAPPSMAVKVSAVALSLITGGGEF